MPEPSCVRKETVGIDILVTSRNGDRKIMHSISIKITYGGVLLLVRYRLKSATLQKVTLLHDLLRGSSEVMLSMLLILLSTLSLIKHLICSNN